MKRAQAFQWRESSRFFFCLFLLCAAEPASAADEPDKPNILLIFVDDLGYGELGCQGNPEIPTPHIDSLASGGVRCTNGYVTAYYCSPSRAGLLTGRYQTRFGYDFNPVGKRNLLPDMGLPTNETTLADALKGAGYATGLVGKWHLGGTEKYHSLRRGFDEFYGFLHEGHFYVPPPYEGVTSFLRVRALPPQYEGRKREGQRISSTHMGREEPPYDADNPVLRGRVPIVEEAYFTDALTREAIGFIGRHATEPFFLYLAYSAVHSPLQGATKYMERFRGIEDVHRRVFAAMLANLDDSIGAVLHEVRQRGLEKNTLIFFISDNGGPTKELTSSNAPLRGGKGNVYEGGIRVPFIVQWKGRLPEGKVYPHPVISLDVFATVCAVSGAPLPARRLDGVNILPHLSGARRELPHDTLFWRFGKNGALRRGDWKMVRREPRGGGPAKLELYDLARDLSESTDLSEKEPARLLELRQLWQKTNTEMTQRP